MRFELSNSSLRICTSPGTGVGWGPGPLFLISEKREFAKPPSVDPVVIAIGENNAGFSSKAVERILIRSSLA
jgi:hypothetical protein